MPTSTRKIYCNLKRDDVGIVPYNEGINNHINYNLFIKLNQKNIPFNNAKSLTADWISNQRFFIGGII